MGNIPRVEPIEECGNNGAKSKRNNIGNSHIFATMHHLNGGDVEFFAKIESGDRATRFVVYIIYIKIFDFWMLAKKPFFNDFGAARDGCDATNEPAARRYGEN